MLAVKKEKKSLLKVSETNKKLNDTLNALEIKNSIGIEPMLKISCNKKHYKVKTYNFVQRKRIKERMFDLLCVFFSINLKSEHFYTDRRSLLSVDCQYTPGSLNDNALLFPAHAMKTINYVDLPLSLEKVQRINKLKKARNAFNRKTVETVETVETVKTSPVVETSVAQLTDEGVTESMQLSCKPLIQDEQIDALAELRHRLADSEDEYDE